MKPTIERPTSNRPIVAVAGTLTYSALGLGLLFVWLLCGDFAYMLRERSAAPVAQLMLRRYQASDFTAGIFLLTVPQIIVFFVGPVVSYWSDRHRGPQGRRIPFLLWPTPITALAMAGLGFSPLIGGALHRWLNGSPEAEHLTVLLVMAGFWTVFEVGVVVSNAVFGGLINDVVPREWLGRFYGMFRAVSLVVGIVFNQQIIGKVEADFALFFACAGLIYGVGFTVMCLMVREGEYPPPPPRASNESAFRIAVKDYFRDCLTRPYYLWVFTFTGLGAACFLPVNTFAIFAAKRYGMGMDIYGQCLATTFALSFLLSVPIGWLVDRFHALRVGLVALALYALLMLGAFYVLLDPAWFWWALLVHGVISGIYWTGTAALGQLLFPKLKFAQFAAAGGLVAAGFSMSLGPALGLLLDALGNDYRYVFLIGSLMAVLALAVGCVVHRKWLHLGGRHRYVSPE